MKKIVILILIVVSASLFAGGTKEPFHTTADYVDMEKFVGDWYVIALIPTIIEKNIANGIENYSLDSDGNIRVEYSFRKENPDGKEKVTYQKGWIIDRESNAEWRVRPLWPLKLPYYVLEVDDNYEWTVIGTNNYDYLWIMKRTPDYESEDLEAIIERMVARGYHREEIIFMEQRW